MNIQNSREPWAEEYFPNDAPWPNGPDDYGRHGFVEELRLSTEPQFKPITPASWLGTKSQEERWLAHGRLLSGDITILSGNGGSGKTEIATALLVSVAAGLGDWLGCVAEIGPALFISCEESEANIRNRVERLCRHRGIDPFTALNDLHLYFPDLDSTWLCAADRAGKITKTPLLSQIDVWIALHKPALVVIDSVAAVFDGDAINRRQVRSFLAMLRMVARNYDTAILLLDHPSVRGMADSSGTANSVDWRNSVRGMMYLSDPPRDDPDARTLEFTKNNRGRKGDAVELRWSGLTFTPAAGSSAVSPHRAAAEREVDDLFLILLDKRNAQGRPVRPSTGRGSAPGEFEADPDSAGVKAPAFRIAMERLLTAGLIKVVTVGPPSKASKQLERAVG